MPRPFFPAQFLYALSAATRGSRIVEGEPALNSLVRNPKDFFAGLIYVGVGLGAIYIGRELPMGTALKMGPAYFPAVLGWLLAFIGVLSLARSFLRKGGAMSKFAWRPLLLITGATLVFGLLVRGVGLAIALPLFIIMTARASAYFRWGPTLLLAAVSTVLCSLVFVVGLGVPLPLVGRWFSGWLGG
jgi:putative tricarboxylic transport membrane protein